MANVEVRRVENPSQTAGPLQKTARKSLFCMILQRNLFVSNRLEQLAEGTTAENKPLNQESPRGEAEGIISWYGPGRIPDILNRGTYLSPQRGPREPATLPRPEMSGLLPAIRPSDPNHI
jgi:hypothetical protein